MRDCVNKDLKKQGTSQKARSTACLYLFTLLIMVLGFCHKASAQEGYTLHYYTQMNAVATDGEYAPYWFTANRNGISSVNDMSGYARYGMSLRGTLGKSQDFHYDITADIVAGYNQQNNFMLQQAYADIGWKWLNLSIGSKERWSEGEYFLNNSKEWQERITSPLLTGLYMNNLNNLGSGGLTYSGNSRPIPQIRIEIPEFIDIPGTNSWLKIRAHIAYGMFTDSYYQEEFTSKNPKTHYAHNILYHSKAAFIMIGKPERFPLTFDGGLEMHTQFGGDIYTHGGGKKLSMPHEPMDFIKAFIPLSGSEDTPVVEQTNISGNQIGSWHAAFTYHSPIADIRLYGEHMFEDFSQLFFIEYQQDKDGNRNIIYYPWRDIKVGLNIRNKSGYLPFISNIRYEYLTTRDQSGALYHDPTGNFKEQMDGCDNYYNHGIYPGWHHWGMGIGNPLVISPEYNTDGSTVFRSNRLIAHNAGINGTVGILPLSYRINYTYSEHWGTYQNPFRNKRYTTSLLAELSYVTKKENWIGTVSLGYDKSNFIGENYGIMFTITHLGTFGGGKK